jgi:hypothetical protein
LIEVEARLKVAVNARTGRRNATARRDCRPDGEADAEIERGQIREQSRATRLSDLVLPVRRGPSIDFEPALNPSLDVEVPLVKTWLERD